MKAFMDDNFLLMNEPAVDLYQNYARDMPIIDYHCHLNPKDVLENTRFNNLTEVWLYGDHYKWRAMRANGIEEKLVTGGVGVSDYDRLAAWTRTVPMTMGNPVYHWSHLELRRIFGITDSIREENAPRIWEQANAKLTGEGFAVRDLIRQAKVEILCTTDDPTDSLEFHLKLQEEQEVGFRMLPSFRPDKGLEITRSTFLPWLTKLEDVVGSPISTYDAFLDALEARVRFFHQVGGRVSDHALDYIPYAEASKEQAAGVFAKVRNGEPVSLEEENQYKTYTLRHLGKLYTELGWVMQYHVHAHRNLNSRMFEGMGPDVGCDAIHDHQAAAPLARLLDDLDREEALPRTIVYSLNAKDNEVLATTIGCFQGGGIPGKMQLGAAWWFNDTKDGMLAQMKSLANIGLLSRFVGMLTDSRSFLSYTRHEYFRRILCNMFGEWIECGEIEDDRAFIGGLIQGICYGNAKEYFRF